MPKISKKLRQLPEAFVSHSDISDDVSREVRKGSLRKLASRLYTSNLNDTPEVIIRRNLWQLVSQYFPQALIADRTALEFQPTVDGAVFIISNHKRGVSLPGISIRPRPGKGPLKNDRPFASNLFLCSPARAYLENMRPSRTRSLKTKRTLTRKEIEERLETLLSQQGDKSLKALRDDAKEISTSLRLKKEYDEFNKIIGSLLGTRKTTLRSKQAKARHAGLPYDPKRLILFDALIKALLEVPIKERIAGKPTKALSFYEAYFSNFIEGTEFEVEEATEIIFNGKIPSSRPADAHDIRGTYEVVSSVNEMSKVPKTFKEFEELLQRRHASIMQGRPNVEPGQFKRTINKAGSTLFVVPDLVRGTLSEGFGYYQVLSHSFSRAVFMMFLISEVHPFIDGNGRTARIFMNAELLPDERTRIIIPTIYRNEYVSALKALSHNTRPHALIKVLDYAQRYTHQVDWSTLKSAKEVLITTNAFRDSSEAEREGIRLELPED